MDLNRMMDGLTKSGALGGLAGGLAGSAATAALFSKSGRKTAKSLLKVGGIAAAGGLAWKAFDTFRRAGHGGRGDGGRPHRCGRASENL